MSPVQYLCLVVFLSYQATEDLSNVINRNWCNEIIMQLVARHSCLFVASDNVLISPKSQYYQQSF